MPSLVTTLEFHEPCLTDASWMVPILRAADNKACEYSFTTIFMWRKYYENQVAHCGEHLFLKPGHGPASTYMMPVGGDLREGVSILLEHCRAEGYPLRLFGAEAPDTERLSDWFPGRFACAPSPGDADYIYNQADLALLAGKKYHGKRNHLKKLLDGEYSYEPLTEKDFDDCITYAVGTYNRSDAYDDRSKVCEQFAINTYFENFHALGLSGGVLRVGGNVAAFTIGERINSDTLGVHIEKAEASVEGAYPAINYLFARSASEGFSYINREEDLGIEGLRKAKRSYHPAFMIEKHTVIFK